MWELLCRWRGRRRFPCDWCFHERFLFCGGCVGIRRGWRAAPIGFIAFKRSKLSLSPNSAALQVNEIILERHHFYQWLNISKLFKDLLLIHCAPTLTTQENTKSKTGIVNWLSHTDCWPQSQSLIKSLNMSDFISGFRSRHRKGNTLGFYSPEAFDVVLFDKNSTTEGQRRFKQPQNGKTSPIVLGQVATYWSPPHRTEPLVGVEVREAGWGREGWRGGVTGQKLYPSFWSTAN